MMTIEQQALCTDNMRLVSHCAMKFKSSGVSWDDLCSCGNLGLAKAAATFAPEKGVRFSTYAGRCIDNEIYMFLRQNRKHFKVTDSLDDELSGTDGLRLHDVVPDETDMAETVETRMLVADIHETIKTLPARNRRVLELHFGLTGEPPLSQKEVAEQMGCSRPLISRMLKQDLSKLKRGVI